VRIAVDGEMLTARPGLNHRLESRLVPEGGGMFRAADEPSRELLFQMGDGGALGYGRYHDGWFSGLTPRASP
jgi:hypothetical protein